MTAGFDPGRLRCRMTLSTPVETPDGAGGATVVWTDVATLWARLDPVGANERRIADHLATVATHRITIRWRDDIAGGMRFTWRGRSFRVTAVHDPDETRRYLVAATVEERP